MAAKISINRAVIFYSIAAGNVLYTYRSRSPADRPAPQTLLQEIDRVQLASAYCRVTLQDD